MEHTRPSGNHLAARISGESKVNVCSRLEEINDFKAYWYVKPHGFQFDIQKFEDQVIQILWQELVDSQKSDEQRQMVEIIRRQISGEVYPGITEEVK